MKNLVEEFNNITKLKIFEIEVRDKKTNEQEYIIFDISIDSKNNLRAEHIALNEEQEKSDKIAHTNIELDEDFSLDENLQELYSECINAIINSTFFRLPTEEEEEE